MSRKEDKSHPSKKKEAQSNIKRKDNKHNAKKDEKLEKPKKPSKITGPIHILGFAGGTNRLSLVVQFEPDQQFLVVPAESLQKQCPLELIDYLEKYITPSD